MSIKKLAVVAVAVGLLSASSASAELVLARIPVRVNVAANVSMQPPAGTSLTAVAKDVEANVWDTLNITIDATVSIAHRAQRHSAGAASARYSRGAVSLELNPQQYGNASLSLYSVSGRRVLRGNASASNGTFNVSRANVAPGVYLLSVKGTSGNSYSTRLTHNGGRLNITATFGGGDVRPLGKEAASASESDGAWTLAATAEGYFAKTLTFVPSAGVNPPQDITLSTEDSFTDPRDNTVYKMVMIGEQVWMAENLNYAGTDIDIGVCYDNDPDNCETYGRLYRWVEAMNIAAEYATSLWSGSDVNHRGACPVGWHLPSRAEWVDLIKHVDPTYTGGVSATGGGGSKLRSQTGWEAYDGVSNTNESGFSALPGGQIYHATGSFENVGKYGIWWNTTELASEEPTDNANYMVMYYGNNDIGSYWYPKNIGLSVRCVRD